jgi:hypothetical protein
VGWLVWCMAFGEGQLEKKTPLCAVYGTCFAAV